MWIVPAAVVVLGAVLFFVLRSGGGVAGILNSGPDNTIPPFDFKIGKATPISVAKADAKPLAGSAKNAASQVAKTMTTLYTEAFLDPVNWRGGTYDQVWSLFDGSSQAAAQKEGTTLTLGTTAGDIFEKVDQPRGRVSVKVLLDGKDQPATAVAIVKFTALGTNKDGTLTLIVSSGQYFLRPGSDGWRIYAFEVSRADHEKIPKPGPSGSPSAVAS